MPATAPPTPLCRQGTSVGSVQPPALPPQARRPSSDAGGDDTYDDVYGDHASAGASASVGAGAGVSAPVPPRAQPRANAGAGAGAGAGGGAAADDEDDEADAAPVPEFDPRRGVDLTTMPPAAAGAMTYIVTQVCIGYASRACVACGLRARRCPVVNTRPDVLRGTVATPHPTAGHDHTHAHAS